MHPGGHYIELNMGFTLQKGNLFEFFKKLWQKK